MFKNLLKPKDKSKVDKTPEKAPEIKEAPKDTPPSDVMPQLILPGVKEEKRQSAVSQKIQEYERKSSLLNRKSTDTNGSPSTPPKFDFRRISFSKGNSKESPNNTSMSKSPLNPPQSKAPISPRIEKAVKHTIELPKDLKESDESIQKIIHDEVNIRLVPPCPNLNIYLAIEDENYTELEELLKDPMLVEFRDDDDNTPLHFAAARNNVKAIEMILALGVTVDPVNKKGFLPIHYAAYNGARDAAYALLSKGASTSKGPCPPMMLAIRKGWQTLAHDLMLFKADVNEKNAIGYSGLHLACLRQDLAALGFYIKIGANVNIQDNIGNTPLFACVYSGFLDGMNLLVQNKDTIFAMKNNKGQNLFHLAVLHQKEAVLKALFTLKRDAMIKLASETDIIMSRLPLHYVMQFQWQDVLVDLVGIQSNIAAQDVNGDTPLHVAIKVGWLLGCRCLMQHPTHPSPLDIKNNDKNTQKMLLKLNPDFKKQCEEKNMVPKKRGWMDSPSSESHH